MRWDYASKITPMAHVLLTWNKSLSCKQCRKWNNWNNDLFKVRSKFIGIMQTKWHRWCILIHWTGHYIAETYVMTSNTINISLLQVKCRGVRLCKLTYQVYRLTLSKSHLHQTGTKLKRNKRNNANIA